MTSNKKPKLPPAKSWAERDIADWNTLSFTEYLKAEHKRLFGIDYAPMGGRFVTEQGILGGLIGTQSRTNPKPRTASNADVKRFIDETFASYTPTTQYPGTSFGFMWTYRKTDWQRICAANMAQARRAEAATAVDIDEVGDWFGGDTE